MSDKRPIILTIMDGWGLPTGSFCDAITVGCPVNFQNMWQNYPHTTLEASGQAVGLPAGQMGNSEVGHMNIGAGRIVYQDLSLINKAIEEGSFFQNAVLNQAMAQVKQGGALHLLGLVSDGGVHSHIEHLFALLNLAKTKGLKNVYIHCFLDGRDVPPASAAEYLQQLEDFCKKEKIGQIATVCGRYYAMDRDKRWDRVEKAWQAMVLTEGQKTTDPVACVKASYAVGITDEFVKPIVVCDATGAAKGQIKDDDSLIFFNFRGDRARELTRAFVDADFTGFPRPLFPKVAFRCLATYDVTIKASVAFPPMEIKNGLGDVLAQNSKKQLRTAETEKYAHVTFFFNGGVEKPKEGEDRVLIPSPKVPTYDLQPAMSAIELTDMVVGKIKENKYDFIVLNYANPDMVGHTGVMQAAVQAVQTVDACLKRVFLAVKEVGGIMLLTADHGNVEHMMDDVTKEPYTAHTTSRVPFILIEAGNFELVCGGALKDIAPTILELMDIPKPKEMTGNSLIKK